MRSTGTFSQDDLYPDLHELRRQATELEQRVESLTASEKRYRYLFENARDIVYSLDLSLNLTSINPAVEAILGYSPAEVVGRPVTQFVVPDHRERALEMLARKLAGSSPTEYEIDLAAKDGRRVTVGIRSVLVEEEGRPVGVQGIARDITERKRLEEALRRGDELFQLVVRATSDAVWDWDLAADAVWWDAGLEKFGYQLGRVPATSAWRMERVHPSESQAVAEGLRTALDGDRNLWSAEYRFLRADGTYACVIDRAYLIRDETGTVRRVIGTLLDITEHRRTQEALRESAERFQILFQHHPQPMFVYDRETLRYLEVNEAAVAKYGYSREEFLRMDITGIRPLEEVPRLIEFLASGSVNLHQTGEWVHRTKDGRRLNVEIVGHHLTFGGRPAALVAANDITARKILEEQLQHSQRMEAVGRLAGGIAHDFNNLLTIIAGYCQLLELRIGPGHPLYANFGEIRKAADRAAALTQQLLAFSRRQVIQPRLLDLNSVVAGMDHMLRRLVGDEVALVLRLDPGLGAVNADVVQVEQILLNLAANSRDAMPEGGTLTIATENADVRAASVDGKHRPGRYVRLRVADTGAGMDSETRSHLFEPFFTTKPEGQGSGLGLSTVYGIVEQSGGHITVSSEPGQGTTFQIYLPRVHTPADAARAGQKPGWGEETVLLVEDEMGVRRLIAETLRASGYEVLEAAGPGEALAMALDRKQPIHLLLTDVVMPDMGGPELAGELARARPELKVLFVSGSLDAARQEAPRSGAGYLRKPFSGEILGRTVRAVLDGAPADIGPA